jgi:hypothetical protein
MSNIKTYTVQKGNTLSAIGKHFGKTVAELKQYNNLSGDTVYIGQLLKLEADSKDLSFQALFLDALRIPIEGLAYMLKFDGQEVKGKTQSNGLGDAVQTQSIDSTVEVWVKRVDGSWKYLAQTVSGHGEKLVTLLSPNLAFKVKPEKLPTAPQPELKPEYSKDNPPPTKSKGTPIKPGHPLHTRKGKAAGVTVIEVDLPEDLIAYFKGYKDEPITEGDWGQVAKELDCDINVLKVFAKVESGGRNAYWRLKKDDGLHVPAILYERHFFHKLTDGVYDKINPDVSWSIPYKRVTKDMALGAQDASQSDGTFDAGDAYQSYATSYLRLLNAYKLDKDAALKSCSWGKFQIMGANYELCGKSLVTDFVQTMCSGEKGQIDLIAKFIQKKTIQKGATKTLWQAVKDKDWSMIAYNYNGPNYAKNGYHIKLEAAYNEYKTGSK